MPQLRANCDFKTVSMNKFWWYCVLQKESKFTWIRSSNIKILWLQMQHYSQLCRPNYRNSIVLTAILYSYLIRRFCIAEHRSQESNNACSVKIMNGSSSWASYLEKVASVNVATESGTCKGGWVMIRKSRKNTADWNILKKGYLKKSKSPSVVVE